MTVAVGPARTATRAASPWLRFALRRLGRFVASLWVLVTAAFLMIHLVPGDPVRAALGMTAPADLVRARRADLGLDDPLWTQYGRYLRDLVQGELGTSMSSALPVGQANTYSTSTVPATRPDSSSPPSVRVAVSALGRACRA